MECKFVDGKRRMTISYSGLGGSRGPIGLLGSRHELLELVGLGPVRDHTLEHVLMVGEWLDAAEFGGRHQVCHDHGSCISCPSLLTVGVLPAKLTRCAGFSQ